MHLKSDVRNYNTTSQQQGFDHMKKDMSSKLQD